MEKLEQYQHFSDENSALSVAMKKNRWLVMGDGEWVTKQRTNKKPKKLLGIVMSHTSNLYVL